MHEFEQINNEVKEEVKRFEQMENGNANCYFDVESIENIFDFYADNYQFDKAERVLNLGSKLHPNSIPLLLKKTVILHEKGEGDMAIQLLEKLLKFEENDPELYFYLGWSHLKMGNLNEAISCYNNALDFAFEEEEYLLYEIAFSFNQMEQYEIVINILEGAILKFPKNEDIKFELAYAYDKVNMLDKSFDLYNQMINVDPFSESTWNNLGILYYKNNDIPNAIQCYDYALSINPGNDEALFNKANALVNTGELRKAFDCYIDYISYGNEDDPMAYHYIADCLVQMDLYEPALRFFELSVKIESCYIPAWIDYITLLICHKEQKKALQKTTQALLATQWFPEFLFLRAKAYLISNNYAEALKWMEKCLDNDPYDLRNISEWLILKIMLEPNKDGFTILYEKYKDSPPDVSSLNYASAAIAFTEFKDFNLAAAYLDAALEEAPENFDYFLDAFGIPEKVLLENDIINKVIGKYYQYE
jgi:tetratricopeptide (TPR) repeat protein